MLAALSQGVGFNNYWEKILQSQNFHQAEEIDSYISARVNHRDERKSIEI